MTSPVTSWQSDWHFQAWHSILMLAIKVCNHFQHHIWIRSHYRLVSKVQTWQCWPGQISFLPPWMVWKLLYRKCTLNHLDTGKFPVQPLSRLNRYLQVSWSPAVCLLMCIYTCPVTFYPFLPLNDRRGWKAMAGIITSQNTRGPPSSATATRDYRHTVYKQVDRSCVAHCRHREGERKR